MKKILLLFVIVLSSCKSKDCASINYKLVDEFERKIKIVQTAYKKSELKVVEYREAIIYLSSTTGIMTLANYSEPVGYLNDMDYKHDMELWKKWLDENRCITISNKE